jgi:hypothetical protein
MNLNLTGRRALAPTGGASALLVLTTIFFCTVSTPVFANGIRDNTEEPSRPEARTLVRTEPAVKPEWVNIVPQSGTEIFFVGTSQVYDTPANARDNARESARIQVLEYYGQVIEKQAVSLSTVSGSTRDTLAPYVLREDEIKTFAQNVVSEVATVAYFTEVYLDGDNKEGYIVYTLHQVNRQKAENEISGFAKKISERYTAAFSQWNTLKAALEGYAFVVKSLEQNPLHRIMAYFETPAGKAGLFEYARLQISELADSVSIDPVPARTVQKTDDLNTVVRLRSSRIPAVGPLKCEVRLLGRNIEPNLVLYNVTDNNSLSFPVYTTALEPGRYTVRIVLPLQELTGGVSGNIGGGFSFEVTALNPLLSTPDAIEAGMKTAVDALATKLQIQTETAIGPFTMTGTDIPSELSDYLTQKVTHYARNNQDRKYRLTEGGVEQAAFFSGFFTKRNDRVDITFELKTQDRDRDGSYIFSIPVNVLENIIGIAVEPENVNNIIILDDVIPATQAETIHIEARLNSNTRTYKHGDYLKLTVTADRDCYFKIIHIDVNNQIKMIYPTRNDSNNFLRANEGRTVFDNPNSRQVLCGPYGAEWLVVTASPVQFPNIEREYNEPWKTATEEAVRAVTAGAGQARYSITVTKPHEEYEYPRPENMTEFYQAIRDDVRQQGGYFEGNAVSGFYIINDIRGSYLAPSDRPDTVEFASYFLDTYSGSTTRGTRTRGSAFNFSFAKPQDINRAVQTVRNSIQEKGGTFSGNEQQGNFSSKGIAGRYQISEMVSVTISEKPIVVPNSLIESEVKKYFGVR